MISLLSVCFSFFTSLCSVHKHIHIESYTDKLLDKLTTRNETKNPRYSLILYSDPPDLLSSSCFRENMYLQLDPICCVEFGPKGQTNTQIHTCIGRRGLNQEERQSVFRKEENRISPESKDAFNSVVELHARSFRFAKYPNARKAFLQVSRAHHGVYE